MMDERIWTLAIVYVVVTIFGVVDAFQFKVAKLYDAKRHGVAMGCLATIVAFAVYPVMILVAGWVDMLLWNTFLPNLLGLPEIDLVTAVGVGWLIALLFKGITPMRVRIFGTVDA